MASNPVRVSQLVDSPSPLTWQESVALVRSIAAVRGGSPAVVASGTFEEFAVSENGEVTAVGSAPPLSVSELALLLARLLPAAPRRADGEAAEAVPAGRPPAGLYFTIARALALVDAPSFASIQDFSAALARFERARSTAVLRHAFSRYTESTQSASTAAVEYGGSATSVEAVVRTGPSVEGEAARHTSEVALGPRVGTPDRRRTRMPSDVLRRMLREEDRRNFLELQARTGAARAAKRQRQTGPDPQMLRRFIREADERTFALMQARTPLRAPRRAGYHAAVTVFALLIGVVALALGGWQRLHPATVAQPTGLRAVAAPQTELVTAAAPAVSETMNAKGAMTAPDPSGTDVVTSEPQASDNPAPSAHAPASKRTAQSVSATRKPAKNSPVVATKIAAAGPVAKRPGRVPRFFAGLYHRLGNLVRRDSGQPAMTE